MYEQKETGRIYKDGESGFALIESYPNQWEQTDLPNYALKSDGFTKKRSKKDGMQQEEAQAT